MRPDIGIYRGKDGVNRLAARNYLGEIAFVYPAAGIRACGQWCKTQKNSTFRVIVPAIRSRECTSDQPACPRCGSEFYGGQPTWDNTTRSCPVCGPIPLVGGWWQNQSARQAILDWPNLADAIVIDGETYPLDTTPLGVVLDRLADAGVIDPVDGTSREMPTLDTANVGGRLCWVSIDEPQNVRFI